MSCGCNKKNYLDSDISGMDETDMKLMGGAVGGYIATAYLDDMLVYDKDGVKKTGSLAENDNMRNGLFSLGGIGLAWMWGKEPIIKGVGIGMTTFGVKQFIKGQYPDAGISGTRVTDEDKYIAAQRASGGDKYIGTAERNRIIDLGLNLDKPTQQQAQQKKVVIRNTY